MEPAQWPEWPEEGRRGEEKGWTGELGLLPELPDGPPRTASEKSSFCTKLGLASSLPLAPDVARVASRGDLRGDTTAGRGVGRRREGSINRPRNSGWWWRGQNNINKKHKVSKSSTSFFVCFVPKLVDIEQVACPDDLWLREGMVILPPTQAGHGGAADSRR